MGEQFIGFKVDLAKPKAGSVPKIVIYCSRFLWYLEIEYDHSIGRADTQVANWLIEQNAKLRGHTEVDGLTVILTDFLDGLRVCDKNRVWTTREKWE